MKLTTDRKTIQRKKWIQVSGKGGIVFVDNDRKVVKEYFDHAQVKISRDISITDVQNVSLVRVRIWSKQNQLNIEHLQYKTKRKCFVFAILCFVLVGSPYIFVVIKKSIYLNRPL